VRIDEFKVLVVVEMHPPPHFSLLMLARPQPVLHLMVLHLPLLHLLLGGVRRLGRCQQQDNCFVAVHSGCNGVVAVKAADITLSPHVSHMHLRFGVCKSRHSHDIRTLQHKRERQLYHRSNITRIEQSNGRPT
jgi:hypothetical protein